MLPGMNWYTPVYIILLTVKHSDSWWKTEPEGTLTANSTYVFIGESFTLKCQLKSSSRYHSSSLCFKDGTGTKVNSTQVYLLNNKTTEMVVPVRKRGDFGQYKCYERCTKGATFINSEFISVEYPPEMITDLRCIRRNWKPLECSWHNPIQYIVPENVVTHLQYINRSGNSGICQVSGNKTHCRWNSSSMHEVIRINVTVTNTRSDDKRSVSFLGPEIERSKIVEPDPPDEVTAVAISSRCLLLSWKHNKVYRELLFSISVHSNAGQLVQVVNKSTEENNEFVEQEVCGLHPFTHYSISIKCIPLIGIKEDPSGYWSESRNVTVLTDEAVPASAPPLLPGLYTSGECTDNARDVIFNWKEMEESEKNGIITGYKVKVCEHDKVDACFENEISEGNIFAISYSLKCDQKYEMQITAKTSVGYSKVHSSVIVDKSTEELRQPKQLIVNTMQTENQRNRLSLRWTPQDENIDTIENIITWCAEDSVTNSCKGPINWKHCEKNTSTSIDVVEPFRNIYGVYTTAGGKSSGIMWTHCVYMSNSTDVTPPQNFIVAVPAISSSMTITWTPPHCSTSKAYITHYILKYCVAGGDKMCTGEIVEKMINSEETDYSITLNGLEPKTLYRFTMLSVATNIRSFETKPLFGTPIETGILEGGVIAGIIIACIAVVIIGVISIPFIIRYTKHGIQKWKRPINITSLSNEMEASHTEGYYNWYITDDGSLQKGFHSKDTTTTILCEELSDSVTVEKSKPTGPKNIEQSDSIMNGIKPEKKSTSSVEIQKHDSLEEIKIDDKLEREVNNNEDSVTETKNDKSSLVENTNTSTSNPNIFPPSSLSSLEVNELFTDMKIDTSDISDKQQEDDKVSDPVQNNRKNVEQNVKNHQPASETLSQHHGEGLSDYIHASSLNSPANVLPGTDIMHNEIVGVLNLKNPPTSSLTTNNLSHLGIHTNDSIIPPSTKEVEDVHSLQEMLADLISGQSDDTFFPSKDSVDDIHPAENQNDITRLTTSDISSSFIPPVSCQNSGYIDQSLMAP